MQLITKVNKCFDSIGWIRPIGNRGLRELGIHLTRYGLTELIYTKKGNRMFLRFANTDDIPSSKVIRSIFQKYKAPGIDDVSLVCGTGTGDTAIPYANHCKYFAVHYKYEFKNSDLVIVEKVA